MRGKTVYVIQPCPIKTIYKLIIVVAKNKATFSAATELKNFFIFFIYIHIDIHRPQPQYKGEVSTSQNLAHS